MEKTIMAKWEREAIPIDTNERQPKWEKEAILVSPEVERPLQRQPEFSKLQIAQRGGGRWGEMPPGETQQASSLIRRFGKQLYNVLGPNLIYGVLKSAKRVVPGEIEQMGKAQDEILAGKLGPVEAERMRESLERGKRRVEKLAPIPVPPPETWGETGVDIGAGLAGFLIQIAALKRGMPKGTSTAAVWEQQNLLSGGTPGMGAASYTAFSAPGKIIKGVTLPAKVGRLAAESVALASVSVLEQKIDTGEIDPVQVGIAAALPVALRTPKAIKSLIRKRNPKVMKALAEVTGVKPQVINVYKGKKTGKLYRDESALRMEQTPTGTKLVVKATGEEVLLDQAASKSAIRALITKPVTIDTTNKAVTDWSKKAQLLNKTERKVAVHKLRQRQSAISKERYKLERDAGTPRLLAARRARRASKGLKAKNPEIEPLKLTSEQQDLYGRKIEQVYPAEYQFQRTGAAEAITKMTEGRIPTNYEFGLLEPIFGRDATKKLFGELIKKRPFSGWELPALTIQAFKSKFGLDIQMFRQGRSLAVRHPILYLKSSWVNARSMAQNKYAERMYTQVKNSPGYMESEKLGWNYVGEAGYSSKRLEYYALGLTERLLVSKSILLRGWGKLLGAGERGAVAGINNMQKGLYDQAVKNIRRLNLTPAKQKLWMKNRAKTHNTFMKILRVPPGKQYQGLRKLKQAANYVLFSPSMTVGRPLSIKAMIANKGSRKYAAGVIASNIASIYALTAIPTYIGHQMRLQNPEEEPDVNGELNILDGNWGKIRYGNTIFDPGGGDAPFYRTVARIGVSAYMQGRERVTGEVTTEVAGKRIPDAGETLDRYFTTRETAALGYAKTILTGKDWLEEPIPRLEATLRALSPEILEATIETGMADGLWDSLATMVATTTSVGVSTYPVKAAATRSKFRDIVSQTKHSKDWDELSMREQNRLRSEHRKQFEILSEKVRKERVGKPISIEKIKEEELRAGKRITSMLSKPNRQWVEDISLGVSRRPKNWYLTDKRYNRYQELIAGYVDERLSRIDFTGMEERRRIARAQIIVKVAKNKALATLRREVGR